MGFSQGFVEDGIVSETGNWNVAQSYSEGVIMGQIRYIKHLQTLAENGTDEDTGGQPQEVIRYEALRRLINALRQMISDTTFAFKRDPDRVKCQGYYKQLTELKKYVSSVSTVKIDRIKKSRTFILKEKEFQEFYDKLDLMKMDIYKIINNNDLIYPTKEEFDPKKWKEAIIKRATTQG